MIRSLYYSPTGELRSQLSVMDMAFALQEEGGLLWVDFEGNPPQDDEPILSKTFGFHPLAIDDALEESHVPKVDDWGQYVYIVLHAVELNTQNGVEVDTHELDVFLGKGYLVTHHDEHIEAIEKAWSTVQRDERHLKNGSDHLLYRLIDEVVASYMPVVEQLDVEIDQTEDQTFDRPTPYTLERIFMLKRATLHLRRIIGPQREVLNKLARDDFDVIDPRERIYYRDIYDHLVRLHDVTESIRDLVSGTLDTYLSVINNRMNDVMKTLTIITTIFMPISFVASFFGMNFFQPSAPLNIWTGWPAFILTMVILVVTPLGMFAWIRRRGWM